MFLQTRTYRHKNCLDIDIYVSKITYRGPNYWKLRVFYVHQRLGYIIEKETVKINKKDFKNWKEVLANM